MIRLVTELFVTKAIKDTNAEFDHFSQKHAISYNKELKKYKKFRWEDI